MNTANLAHHRSYCFNIYKQRRGRKYQAHRLKTNDITSKSNAITMKTKQQQYLMENHNAHHQYNALFKLRENTKQLSRQNEIMLNKITSASKVQRPNSITLDKLRNSMLMNRQSSKRQQKRTLMLQNNRFIKKLYDVRPTINPYKHSRSFSEHIKRSLMLSRYPKDRQGNPIIKNRQYLYKKAIKLQPINRKLEITDIQVVTVPVRRISVKINSEKLLTIGHDQE